MKKHLASFTNLLAVIVSLAAFAVPALSQAQVTGESFSVSAVSPLYSSVVNTYTDPHTGNISSVTLNPLFSISATAQGSAFVIRSARVSLGSSTAILSVQPRFFLTDQNGNILANIAAVANSNTVVREADGSLSLNIAFSIPVNNGETKSFAIAIDQSSSTLPSQFSLTIPVNGIRATDSAGVPFYGSAQVIYPNSGGSSGGGGGGVCYNYAQNLAVGSTGADVTALQSWLIAAGFHIPAIESGLQPKGYYGNQTGNAVSQFQATIGISETSGGYGYFGTKTRSYLNANCTIAVTTTPSIRITSPNGGEVVGLGTTRQITWSTSNIPASNMMTIGVREYSPVSQDISLAGDAPNTGSYTWNVNQEVGRYSVFIKTVVNGVIVNDWSNDGLSIASSSVSTGGGGGCYSFVRNLSLGSTGADVVALQTWLIANGYHIPAIESGAQPKGYYGNQTADALTKYQIAVGVSEQYGTYGYFGPLTRASVNGEGCTTTTPPLSTQQLNASIDSASPLATVVQIPSTPGQTNNIPLAIFDLQSLGNPSTLQSIKMNFDTGGQNITGMFINIMAKIGTRVYYETNIDGQNVEFGNMSVSLPANTVVPVIISATIGSTGPGGSVPTNGSSVTVSLPTKGVIAVDSSSNPISVSPIMRTLIGNLISFGTQASTTTPVTNPPTNNNTVTFQADFTKTLNLNTVPSSVTLSAAADNQFLAYVNGTYVGTGADTQTGDNFDKLATFNIAPYLHTGSNTIKITGQNYYTTFTAWPQNAFGLLYKVTDSNGNILAASDGSETIGSATIGGGSSVVLSQPHQWYLNVPGASWIWDSADPLYATYLSYIGQGQTPAPTQLPGLTISPVSVASGQQVTLSYTAPSNASSMTLSLSCPSGVSMPYGTGGNDNCNTSVVWTPSFPTASFMTAINKTSTTQRVSVTLSAKYSNGSTGGTTGYVDVQPGIQTTTGTPVISGITAPTQLSLNQTGTWTVSASDPQNSSLSYSINWGDNVCPAGYVCSNASASTQFVQQASFTHSYATAGTYTVSVTVKNSAGLTAQSSATVNVTGGTVTQPPTVTPTSVTASVVDASSDKAGIWNVFSPGTGRVNGNNPYDWHWNATIRTGGKVVSGIAISSGSSAWSSSDSGKYPLVMYVNGGQINYSYAQLGKSTDPMTLDLYGQPENTTWTGGTITVSFADGTSASAQIPASSITIPAVTTASSPAALSLDAASPLSSAVPVTDSTNGQYLGLPVLVFDIKNNNASAVALKSVTAQFSLPGNLTAAYLFQGSTQVQSASVSNGTAYFNNITNGTNGATIPANTTLPYTVKVDVTGVNTGSVTVSASVNSTGISLSDANGNLVAINGSAQGGSINVVAASGPMVSLVGTPVITKAVQSTDQFGNATTSYSATFNLNITAVGSNATFGLPGSASPAIASDSSFITVMKNGVADPNSPDGAIVTYSQPTNTTGNGSSFTVGANQSVTLPVMVTFLVRNPGANTYAVKLNAIRWSTASKGTQTTSINASTGFAVTPSQSAMTAAIYDAIRAYYAGH